MGGETAVCALGYLLVASFSLGLELGVFTTAMRLEYLKGHIGEKRFASEAINTNGPSLFARFSVTVLFYGTVFSISPAPLVDNVNRLSRIFRSILIQPVSSKTNF